jgi:Rhodopirellula transposase DDE domain
MTLAGENIRTGADGKAAQGWDHDPPAKRKRTPWGIWMLATGALTIVFGTQETRDCWVEGLPVGWRDVQGGLRSVRRWVIDLDHGPNNSGSRPQFLKRRIEFADWSGLEIRLVYYPPSHSKYNPIERCWSALEQTWGGALLNGLKVLLQRALRMRWRGQPPTLQRLAGDDPEGVRLTRQEMKLDEARLERSKTLPKYDLLIRPQPPKHR